MMNHTLRKTTTLVLPAIALALALGCQGEEPQAKVVAAPPPPPAPPKPTVVSVADLMAQLNIDPRVMMTEEKAPATTEERKAVLELFDGFARGDDQVVSSYISYADRSHLEELVSDGQWKETTGKISQIRVESGLSLEGDPCVLAIIQTGAEYQPQLWQYEPGTEKPFTFDSVYAPPDMMNKLSGTDWITAWFEIIAKEMELAQVPDEDLAPAQQILDENEASAEGSAPSADPGGGPGVSPMRAPSAPSGPRTTPGRGPGGPSKR